MLVLASYLEISRAEFVRMFAVGSGFLVGLTVVYAATIARRLEQITSWLEGERDPEATVAAWRTAVSLPWQQMRREAPPSPLGLYWWATTVAWSLYAAWELDFPAYGALAFVFASLVYTAAQVAQRFLVAERVLRPVLAEIGAALPLEVDVAAPGVPLRWRLLSALPAISVMTGTVVGGLVDLGESGLGQLAVAVLPSIAVAALISLNLSLLLADSITHPIAQLRAATERVGAGDFDAVVPVVTTDETGALTRAFNRMTAGLAERERIREAFGTYVDKEVAEHILREGTSLAGEEVEVTMMFIDIRDFTGFSERATAPEVVATINRMFERAVPIIHAHHGHVDKYVGDGLLAVFGAPRRQDDHADQALAAALEIGQAVADEFGGELQIGIGLNSGTVVAGNVGGGGRLEFSVIGDAVNVAARVEAATRKTGDVVLLAENVRRLLRTNTVPLEERPGVPLKGKSEPIMLYAPSSPAPTGGA